METLPWKESFTLLQHRCDRNKFSKKSNVLPPAPSPRVATPSSSFSRSFSFASFMSALFGERKRRCTITRRSTWKGMGRLFQCDAPTAEVLLERDKWVKHLRTKSHTYSHPIAIRMEGNVGHNKRCAPTRMEGNVAHPF